MSSDHNIEFGVPTVESLLKLHAAVDVISKMPEGTLPETYSQFVPEVNGLLLERQTQYGLKRGKDAEGKKKGAVWTLQSICVSFNLTWTPDAFPYLQPLRPMSDLCRNEANPAAIKKAVRDAEQTLKLLNGFVSSFKLLMKSEVAPIVRVWLTPLLAFRFWPEAARRMTELTDSNSVLFETQTFEPAVLTIPNREAGDWELLISYGSVETVSAMEKVFGTANVLKLKLHPCLMVPPHSLPVNEDTRGRLNRPTTTAALRAIAGKKPLAIIKQFESVFAMVEGAQVLETLRSDQNETLPIIRMSTTLELHKFVHSGLGTCITTIEAEGESDAKGTDSFEIEELKGKVSLFIVRRLRDKTDAGNSKAKAVNKLFETLKAMCHEFEARYELATQLTTLLSPMRACYLSSSTQRKDGTWGFDWWGASVRLQVKATLVSNSEGMLWVSGELVVDKAINGQHDLPESVEADLPLRIFGRLSKAENDAGANNAATDILKCKVEPLDGIWQMSLRGMSVERNGRDLISIFVMFRVKCLPNKQFEIEPLVTTMQSENGEQRQRSARNTEEASTHGTHMVGHWLGNLDYKTKPVCPDAGAIVFVSHPERSTRFLQEASRSFVATFPVSLSPGFEVSVPNSAAAVDESTPKKVAKKTARKRSLENADSGKDVLPRWPVNPHILGAHQAESQVSPPSDTA